MSAPVSCRGTRFSGSRPFALIYPLVESAPPLHLMQWEWSPCGLLKLKSAELCLDSGGQSLSAFGYTMQESDLSCVLSAWHGRLRNGRPSDTGGVSL